MEIKDNKSSPLWLHINLWKTVSCVVLWGAAALASPSSAATATARQKAAADFASSSSSSALTPTGATFLACWNSYCLCWLLKSSAYPDPRWASPATRAQKGFVWGVLTGYLVAPAAMLFWRSDGCSPAALGVFAFLYSLGNFWHYVSDAHKHTALSLRPGKLVSSGLFAHSRNPNYFGELLTYMCLAGLPACALRSWLPLLPLGVSLVLEWIPNMKQKDSSLKRHGAEWNAWAARAPFLLPWRSMLETLKELRNSSEVVTHKGCGSEVAEVGENEIEKERKEGETAPVLTLAAKKKGGSAPSTRKREIRAGGR